MWRKDTQHIIVCTPFSRQQVEGICNQNSWMKMISIRETASVKHRQYKLYYLDWCFRQVRSASLFTIKPNTYYASNICKDKPKWTLGWWCSQFSVRVISEGNDLFKLTVKYKSLLTLSRLLAFLLGLDCDAHSPVLLDLFLDSPTSLGLH